eukprot:SAG31_NODE_5688_length_2379_cov_3.068860_5_plen_155_part_00
MVGFAVTQMWATLNLAKAHRSLIKFRGWEDVTDIAEIGAAAQAAQAAATQAAQATATLAAATRAAATQAAAPLLMPPNPGNSGQLTKRIQHQLYVDSVKVHSTPAQAQAELVHEEWRCPNCGSWHKSVLASTARRWERLGCPCRRCRPMCKEML